MPQEIKNSGLDLVKTKEYLESARGQKRYLFSAAYTLPASSTLPQEFMYLPLEIKNQLGTDFCMAESITEASELQEGVIFEPSYSFMKIKEIMGEYESFGADPESGAKAALQGFLPRSETPYTLNKTEDRDFLANPINWPVRCNEIASKYAKRAYFWVEKTRTHDLFDAIRASMQLFKNEKRSVVIGVPWCYEWSNKTVISEPGTEAGGHAVNVLGWKNIGGAPYLAIQNHYGKEMGENGIQYVSRQVVNKMFVFALFFADLPDNMTHEQIVQISALSRVNFIMRLLYKLFPWLQK